MAMTAAPIRALAFVRLLLALVLVGRPARVGRAVAGKDASPPPSWLVRVLGGRLLVESLAELARPTPAVVRAGAGIDAAHAVSMLVLAVSPSHRRAVLASGAVAAVGAGLSLWLTRPGPTRPANSHAA
jgi:hypothetical protein